MAIVAKGGKLEAHTIKIKGPKYNDELTVYGDFSLDAIVAALEADGTKLGQLGGGMQPVQSFPKRRGRKPKAQTWPAGEVQALPKGQNGD